MSAFTDWLADRSARRVVLVELVESGGTHYLSDEGYTTGPADTPANTYYVRRLSASQDIEISRSMSGPFNLRGGVYNAAEIVVVNVGDYDDWHKKKWQSATIRFGDPSWSISQFSTRWSGSIDRVDVAGNEIRFTLADKYAKLREPAQKVPHWFGQILGQMRPLSYGYPKNVKPPLVGTSNPDYYVHEANTCEDPVVSRYLNQASFGTPSVVTESGAVFELGSMPTGTVTIDTKGVQDSGGTWIEAPGAALKHLVSRSVDLLFGYATGGGETDNIFIDSNTRAVIADQGINIVGLTIKCVSQDDPAPPWSSPAVGHEISAYDSDTGEVTITDTWEADVSTRQEGDLFHIELSSEANRVGALDPATEVDTAAFDAYDTAIGSPQVGIWIDRGQSFVTVLDAVLHPGGFHAMTPAGKLTIGALVDPAGETADLALGENDLIGEIEVSLPQAPLWRQAVGYDRNYSPGGGQDANDVSDTERQIFVGREYSYVRDDDRSILNDWPDEARDITFDTVYTELAGAQAEFDRYWSLFSTERHVYTVRADAKPIGQDLGDVLEITDPRHDLDDGVNLVMVSIRENLTRARTEMELWG